VGSFVEKVSFETRVTILNISYIECTKKCDWSNLEYLLSIAMKFSMRYPDGLSY